MELPVNKKLKLSETLGKEEEEEFFERWKNSDVVLSVEEKSLHVHSQVLSVASPVFERLFRSKSKESKTRRVEMVGKRYADVLCIIKLLYPSTVSNLG